MATQGTTTINFGVATIPWTVDASVDVTGQAAILSTSLVEAWIMAGTATADHSEDEHMIEDIRLICGIPTAGTGFTIFGFTVTPVYGQYTVQWVWN